MTRPPLPPFTENTARKKVRAAENAWNSRNPDLVTPAYTKDSSWRNRGEFLTGHAEIHAFLTRKWVRETNYRLIKELWTFAGNRIAVRFAYEWQNANAEWFRAYGNENWQFSPDGRMSNRLASINDLPIAETERLFRWPSGMRPDDHPGLSELGL
ncbi:MAG: nuclear transport factor 2 family protein [Rhizobiales bacterium]|nr:nuclear transport factor 2 family protein [Hyphomicrobiales bacterium]